MLSKNLIYKYICNIIIPQLKEMILDSLQKPESSLSSTVALGMDADLRHVSRVIHAGPPTTMESL